jgi:hypothetical protein
MNKNDESQSLTDDNKPQTDESDANELSSSLKLLYNEINEVELCMECYPQYLPDAWRRLIDCVDELAEKIPDLEAEEELPPRRVSASMDPKVLERLKSWFRLRLLPEDWKDVLRRFDDDPNQEESLYSFTVRVLYLEVWQRDESGKPVDERTRRQRLRELENVGLDMERLKRDLVLYLNPPPKEMVEVFHHEMTDGVSGELWQHGLTQHLLSMFQVGGIIPVENNLIDPSGFNLEAVAGKPYKIFKPVFSAEQSQLERILSPGLATTYYHMMAVRSEALDMIGEEYVFIRGYRVGHTLDLDSVVVVVEAQVKGGCHQIDDDGRIGGDGKGRRYGVLCPAGTEAQLEADLKAEEARRRELLPPKQMYRWRRPEDDEEVDTSEIE